MGDDAPSMRWTLYAKWASPPHSLISKIYDSSWACTESHAHIFAKPRRFQLTDTVGNIKKIVLKFVCVDPHVHVFKTSFFETFIDQIYKITKPPLKPSLKSHPNIHETAFEQGWKETKFLEEDREIRLIKIHFKTETEKKWMLIFCLRRGDLYTTRNFRQDWELWCLFLRDQDKNQLLLRKKIEYLAYFCW